MKKIIGLCILAIISTVFLPLNASALTGEIFASSNATMVSEYTTEGGKQISIKNKEGETKIYLGANVVSGTLTEYKAHIELENSDFTYKSFTKASGWSGTVAKSTSGNGIDIDLTSTKGVTGRTNTPIVTLTLSVADSSDSTKECLITMTNLMDTEPEPTEPAPKDPEPAETPKCEVVDGKYYDTNGNQVSKEAYDAACTTAENPQTGSFLPYTIIIAGVAIAGGLYLVTKKNNKIYKM